jgi:hypothetical protein
MKLKQWSNSPEIHLTNCLARSNFVDGFFSPGIIYPAAKTSGTPFDA